MIMLDEDTCLSQAITLQGLFVLVENDETLTPRLRDWRLSNLRVLGRIVSRCTGGAPLSLAAIRCDMPWLNACLFKLPPKAHGLGNASFSNVITDFRGMLRQLGLLDPQRASLAETSPWQPALAALRHAHCRFGLGQLAAWCDERGILPEAVTDDTLAAFEQYLRTRHLRPDIPGHIGNLVKNWRKAQVISSAWPQAKLKTRARAYRYRFDFAAFPPAVQDAVETFRRRLAGELQRGPFSGGDAVLMPLRPASVASRVYSIKLALNAYVEVRGIQPEQVTSLAELLEPDAFMAILTYHWERAVQRRIARGELAHTPHPPPDAGNTSQTAAIADALMILAKHVARLPEPALRTLSAYCAKVRPAAQPEISRKNDAILDKMLEPKTRALILRLPATLMRIADAMTDRPRQAAVMAMMAVALEIELNKPLRLANLTRLRLGEELQFTDPRQRRPTKINIQAQYVKNGVDIAWPISEQLGNLITHFVRHHRAHLGNADTPWLFPGRLADGSRHCETMRSEIKAVFAEHIGIVMHPHILRAFVCCLILKTIPAPSRTCGRCSTTKPCTRVCDTTPDASARTLPPESTACSSTAGRPVA